MISKEVLRDANYLANAEVDHLEMKAELSYGI
jgi:hypothetical protein